MNPSLTTQRSCTARNNSSSVRNAQNPPMLTSPSFLEDMTAMSAQDIISLTICGMLAWAYSGSRSRMNQAFSANRVASITNGMPACRAISDAARRFANATGWPPVVLQVTVATIATTLDAPSVSMSRANSSRSKLPFQSWYSLVLSASLLSALSARAPASSMCTFVVSKWKFDRNTGWFEPRRMTSSG